MSRAAAGPLDQAGHQGKVEHRRLVDDDHVGGEGMVGSVLEPVGVTRIDAQKAVYRSCFQPLEEGLEAIGRCAAGECMPAPLLHEGTEVGCERLLHPCSGFTGWCPDTDAECLRAAFGQMLSVEKREEVADSPCLSGAGATRDDREDDMRAPRPGTVGLRRPGHLWSEAAQAGAQK